MSRLSVVNTQNLLTFSEQFDNAAWTDLNCTVTANTTDTLDPIGTNTADIIVEDNSNNLHRISQGSTPYLFGQVYTFSAYVKAGIQTWCALQGDSGGTGLNYFNLSTGAIGNISGATASVQNAGNGWWRISITYTSKTGASSYIYPSPSNGGATYQGVLGTKAIYVWGAQVVKANWPGSYTKTLGSTVNTGYIRNIFNSNQNLVSHSQNFSDASWIKTTGVTLTDNTADTTDPMGGNTATKFVYDGSGSINVVRFQQGTATTWNAGVVHTMSLWLKALSGSPQVYLQDNNATGPLATLTTTWTQYIFTSSFSIQALFNWNFFNITNNAMTLYIWQAQGVIANWTGPYTLTTTSALNNGNIRSIIAPTQNLYVHSEEFDNAAWIKSVGTVTANTIANPVDGLTTADTFTATAGAGFHYVAYSNGTDYKTYAGAAGPFTFSIYVKRNNNDWISFVVGNNVSGSNTLYFNTATGLFGSTGGNAATYGATSQLVQTLPNGWYRIACKVPSMPQFGGSTSGFGIFLATSDGGNSFTAAGTEAVYLFGAQLDNANWAGTYQQTVATSFSTNIRNLALGRSGS